MNHQLLQQCREQLEFRRGQIADCIASIDAVLLAERALTAETAEARPAQPKIKPHAPAPAGGTPAPRQKPNSGAAQGNLSEVMRGILAGWKDRKFTREELQREILRTRPDMKEKAIQVSARLIGMIGRDVSRVGQGSNAVYSVLPIKDPAATAKRYDEFRKEIKIPRPAGEEAPEENG